ncbi:MAG: hypothetical protein AAF447_06615 [Myxococcota bacterium]
MSDGVLVRGAYGGSLRQTGPQRLEAELPHGLLTALMLVPILLFGVGSLASIAGLAARGELRAAPLIGLLMGLALAVALAVFAGRRMRSMGRFVIDGAAGRVIELRGQQERASARFDEVARVERRWDPFHRGFVPHHWLVLTLASGRRYRLAKGPKGEVDAVLRLLASWGLPAAAT